MASVKDLYERLLKKPQIVELSKVLDEDRFFDLKVDLWNNLISDKIYRDDMYALDKMLKDLIYEYRP